MKTSSFFMTRALAFGVDLLGLYLGQIIGAYFGAFLALFLSAAPEAPDAVLLDHARQGFIWGFVFWGFVCWFLNFGVLQGMTGQTIGKMIFRLQVVKEDGTPIGVKLALVRSFCYWVSALPLGFGFLSAIWDSKKQAWHDLLCFTMVVKPQKAKVIPFQSWSEKKAA